MDCPGSEAEVDSIGAGGQDASGSGAGSNVGEYDDEYFGSFDGAGVGLVESVLLDQLQREFERVYLEPV